MPRAFLRGFQRPAFDSRGGPFASMRPRREVLLTTFADPSTFPSVFESPETPEIETPELENSASTETAELENSASTETAELENSASTETAELENSASTETAATG